MAWPVYLPFILLLLILAVQLFLLFWLRHWPSVLKQRNESILPSVSIVVCSHNDSAALKSNLPFLLNQSYELFEVIVVDDHSEDDTAEWLHAVSLDKLRVVTLRNNKKPGKRWALAAGIKAAKYEWVVLTDADCRVLERNWLSTLAGYLSEVYIGYIGYGPHQKTSCFFNKMVRFDTTRIASLYLSSAAGGFPYMGVGRNMGWHRSVFQLLIQALENLPTASGDDDLVLQKMRKQGKILAIADPDTFVYSEPKKNWESWVNQKSRHHTTGWRYHWRDQLWLGAWELSAWLFYPVWLICLLSGVDFWFCFWVLMLRSGFVWGWMAVRFNKLLEKDLILYLPLLEIIHTFVLPVFSFFSIGRTRIKWK